ncbi:MAG: NAD(P)H-dependent oxidoreductase [Gammaproteobacteria bacterium]|nr:NAD(P)H-dependent oxidoreductase [Gammaproteobacteria bacterium]
MAQHIVIIQGHPDPAGGHLCHALANAYRAGAESAGREVRALDVAQLDFPLIRSKEEFEHGKPPEVITEAQNAIHASEHLLILYPLWLGTMPALLKAFFEQVFRYDFAFEPQTNGRFKSRLKGRSARIVVTMGMPALAYRWFFRAHSLKSLERNVLKFAGIAPVRESLFGMVDQASDERRQKWLAQMQQLGAAGR